MVKGKQFKRFDLVLALMRIPDQLFDDIFHVSFDKKILYCFVCCCIRTNFNTEITIILLSEIHVIINYLDYNVPVSLYSNCVPIRSCNKAHHSFIYKFIPK